MTFRSRFETLLTELRTMHADLKKNAFSGDHICMMHMVSAQITFVELVRDVTHELLTKG